MSLENPFRIALSQHWLKDADFNAELASVSQILGFSELALHRCISSLALAQAIGSIFPERLVLRGGLAAQLYVRKRFHQRLSSDVDFYFFGTPSSGMAFVQGSFRDILLKCGLVDHLVLRSSECFELPIPMISLDVVLGGQDCSILPPAEAIKVDITFVPSMLPGIMLEPDVFGLRIGERVQVVPIESVVAEKVLKFAGEGIPFPSRKHNALAKQVYDISNLTQSSSWSNDYKKLGAQIGEMLERESIYRQRALSYGELISMMQTGWTAWREHVECEEGWRGVRDFELQCVSTRNHATYQRWTERSEQIRDLLESLVNAI